MSRVRFFNRGIVFLLFIMITFLAVLGCPDPGISVSWGGMSGLSPETGTSIDTTPTLSWDAVDGAVSYEVQIAGSEAGLEEATKVLVSDSANEYTPSTLTSNHTHYWRVRAMNGSGQTGAWSTAHSLEVNWEASFQPENGSTSTNTTPTLSWDAVDGAVNYEVQIAGSEAGLENATIELVPDSANEYTPLTALTDNQTHYWRVRVQAGAWSSIISLSIGYNIGDTGPAGGIVFYDKGSYSDDWRYLEAAPSDQSTGIEWGGDGTSAVGTSTMDIGAGETNTETIVTALGSESYAARLCYDLELGGYDDWFLPSLNELNELNNTRDTVGGFASTWYWSSSEHIALTARATLFREGSVYSQIKTKEWRVRAVRAF